MMGRVAQAFRIVSCELIRGDPSVEGGAFLGTSDNCYYRRYSQVSVLRSKVLKSLIEDAPRGDRVRRTALARPPVWLISKVANSRETSAV